MTPRPASRTYENEPLFRERKGESTRGEAD